MLRACTIRCSIRLFQVRERNIVHCFHLYFRGSFTAALLNSHALSEDVVASQADDSRWGGIRGVHRSVGGPGVLRMPSGCWHSCRTPSRLRVLLQQGFRGMSRCLFRDGSPQSGNEVSLFFLIDSDYFEALNVIPPSQRALSHYK